MVRITQREQDNLKLRLLDELSRTPLFTQLIFRGASALHGVYLQERYSEDLDFFASPAVAAECVAVFEAVGLSLEVRPNAVPIYVRRGPVHERVELGVDVIAMHYSEERFLMPQEAIYHAINGGTARVRTYSLAALLARKLRYILRRQFAVDFYDLWIGFQKHPECIPEIKEIVQRRETSPGNEGRYQAKAAMAHLNKLESTWEKELYTLMPRVPEFGQVRHDLAVWLPSLELGRRL